MQSQETFGLGIYSFADAARFVGSKPSELRRWLQGYKSKRDDEFYQHPPLWSSQLADTDIDGIGFRDLVELRFVRTFVSCGVPLNLVRRTIEELYERLGKAYPFTSTTFKTDGRRIFMELLNETGNRFLIDIVKRQNVMAKVIGPSLREGIELNLNDQATRWYPVQGSKSVVFDPERSFGQPILAESGVPTIAIFEAVKAEGGDERRVARIYDIPLAAVRKAIRFETQVAA